MRSGRWKTSPAVNRSTRRTSGQDCSALKRATSRGPRPRPPGPAPGRGSRGGGAAARPPCAAPYEVPDRPHGGRRPQAVPCRAVTVRQMGRGAHPYPVAAGRAGRPQRGELEQVDPLRRAEPFDAVQSGRRAMAAHQLRAQQLERRRPHPPVHLPPRHRPRAPADPMPALAAQPAGEPPRGPARRDRPDRQEDPAPGEGRQLVHTPNDPRKRDTSHPLWKTCRKPSPGMRKGGGQVRRARAFWTDDDDSERRAEPDAGPDAGPRGEPADPVTETGPRGRPSEPGAGGAVGQ